MKYLVRLRDRGLGALNALERICNSWSGYEISGLGWAADLDLYLNEYYIFEIEFLKELWGSSG